MKKYKLIIICAIAASIPFICCKEVRKDSQSLLCRSDNEMLELEIQLDRNSLPFDSLMDFVSLVKLETTENNLVGSVSQILFARNKIVVVDSYVSKTITVYDKSGKFLNRIGTLGQGPGEYSYLGHVTLTPDKSMVVVVDMGSGYLKYFGLDGNFIKSKKTPFWFSSCEFITDEIIAGNYDGGNTLYGENNSQYKPQLIITNLQGNVFHSGFKSYYNKKFTMSTMMPLRKFEDEVFYSPPFSDTIYHLTQKGIYPKYHLNMSRTKPLIINADMTNESYNEYTENNPMFNGDIIELKDASVFHFFECYSNWFRFAIYSKKLNKVFSCTGTLKNPFFYLFTAPKARYKDNMLVVDASSANILMSKNTFYKLGEKKVIDDLFCDLTEDSNPVLFFYKVKI